MGYSKRIDTLCSHIGQGELFADVGCDHGYCSQYALESGSFRRVIFSDISKGSLSKAESLLAPFVREGRAIPVLGDGFFGVPKEVDEVLIAGMGGSEIIAILSDRKRGFLPKRFILQPMHDGEKLRRFLVERGCSLERDYTFEDGKFYELIVGKAGGQVCDEYSDAEYEFGKENLRKMPEAFVKQIEKRLANIDRYLRQPTLQEESRQDLLSRKERLEGVLQGAIK